MKKEKVFVGIMTLVAAFVGLLLILLTVCLI